MYTLCSRLALFFLLLGMGLFVLKYARTAKVKPVPLRGLPFVFAGWYPGGMITGTSSQRFRHFMIVHNRLTAAMWSSLLLSLLLYVLDRAVIIT